MSSEMCCDACAQGSRVKVVPLILYCAGSWGYRVYNYCTSHQSSTGKVCIYLATAEVFPFGSLLTLSWSKCSSKELAYCFDCLPNAKLRCWGRGRSFTPRDQQNMQYKATLFPSPRFCTWYVVTLSLVVHYCREAAWLKLWRQVWIVLL